MKNLFKKLLACCLALCMVLTLCVGALTVSAEDVVYDGTFTIVGDEVTTDDASAVVNYTAQADCGIAAAEINVDIPDGFAIDELELITEDENVEALFAKSADSTEAPEAIYAGDVYGDEEGETLTDVGDVFTYLIRVYADEVEASTAAITLEITYVPTGEKFAVGNHAVTADIESCKNATDPLLNLEVTLTAEIVVTEAHTHNYVGAVTKEATCTEAGVMTYTCTCGEGTYTEEIPVIPHTEETIPAVDATCTTAGSTAGVKCSVCDTVITAPEAIEATGHDWDEGVIDPDATCTDEGVKTYTCATCGETKTEAVSAKGHTAGDAKEENRVEAKPGIAGSYDMVVRCTVCNAILSTESFEIEALPLEHVHAYSYDYDADAHWQVCSNEDGLCDAVTTEKVVHTFDENTGLCVCGLKLDSTLKYVTPSVGFATTSLQLTFAASGTVINKYDDIEFVIIPGKYDTATKNLDKNVEPIIKRKAELEDRTGGGKKYIYQDIQLYELGVQSKYMLRAYDEGKLVAISPDYYTSPVDYLKARIGLAAMTPEFKAVATDILIVCDESIKRLVASVPDSDMAKAPSVLEGVDISNATKSVDTYNTIDEVNTTNPDFDKTSGLKHRLRISPEIGKVVTLNFRINDANKELDREKLVVRVTGGGLTQPKDYTGAAAFTDYNTYINLKFEEIGLHQSNENIRFEVIYDGEAICDYTYSVETYLGSMQNNAAIGGIAKALLHLGYSFRVFQTTQAQ